MSERRLRPVDPRTGALEPLKPYEGPLADNSPRSASDDTFSPDEGCSWDAAFDAVGRAAEPAASTQQLWDDAFAAAAVRRSNR